MEVEIETGVHSSLRTALSLQAAAARLNAGLSHVTLTFLAKSKIRLLFFLSRLLSRLIDTFPRISIVWNVIFAHCLASTIVEVFASEQAESESSLYAFFCPSLLGKAVQI